MALDLPPKKKTETGDTAVDTTVADVPVVNTTPTAKLDLPPKKSAALPPKPKKSDLSGTLFVDPVTGTVSSSDLETQKQILEGRVEAYKGIASGAGQAVTGIGQFAGRTLNRVGIIGPEFEQLMADTAKTLQDYGAPETQPVGEALPYVFGGEILGGLKGAGALALGGLEGAGALASRIPGVTKGLTAAGEYLAPLAPYAKPVANAVSNAASKASNAASKAYEMLPEAKTVFPESLVNGFNRLRGVAPKAATEAAEIADPAIIAASPEIATQKINGILASLKNLAKGVGKSTLEGGKGAATGAAMGAVFGELSPRAERTRKERNDAEWKSVVDGLKWGAGLGGGAALAGEIIAGLGATWSSMTLAEQKKAVEEAERILIEQQKSVSDLAGKAVTQEEANITAATAKQAGAEAALSPMDKRLNELARAKREAEKSPEIRAQEERNIRNIRQKDPSDMDPRALLELQPKIEQKIQANTREAQDIASRTGISEEQATKLVADQQAIVDKSEADAAALAESFSTRKTMDGNELATEIQELADAREKALEANVKKNAGYNQLDEKYGAKGKPGEPGYKPAPPLFPVKPLTDAIDRAMKSTIKSTIKGYLADLKNNIQDAASKGKVSFDTLEEARQDLSDAYSKGIIEKGGTARSSGGKKLTVLEPVMAAAKQGIIDVAPEFETVLKRYAELKTPLEPYGKGGVFEGITEEHYGTNYATLPGDVLTQVLLRTKKGGEGLADLVANNKELKGMVEEHLNERLFGPDGRDAAKVTEKTFNTFKDRYKDVIESAGLTDVFDSLASARSEVEKSITEAKKGLKTVKGEIATDRELKIGAETDVTSRKRLEAIQARRKEALEGGGSVTGLNLPPELAAKPVVKTPGGPELPTEKGLAAEAAKNVSMAQTRLGREATELEEKAAPVRKTAKEAAAELASAQSNQKAFGVLQDLVDTTPKEQLESRLRGFLTQIRKADNSVLSGPEFKEALETLQKAADEYKRTNNALKFDQDLRTYMITRGISAAGLSTLLGGYGAYRIGRGE
jgi:ribosomal protein S20